VFFTVLPKLPSSINDTYSPFINPLEIHFGQELILICPLESNPRASYKWYFKNESSDRDDSFVMIDKEYQKNNGIKLHGDRKIIIDEFLEEDNGKYVCVAENYLGTINFTFPRFHVNSEYMLFISYALIMLLYLSECESFHPAYPVVNIVNQPNSTIGDNISIECKVSSIPHTHGYSLVWYKNNKQVYDPSGRVHDIQQDFNKKDCSVTSTLYIYNATFNDSANYSCSVTISDYPPVVEPILLNVTLPTKQPLLKRSYKILIIEIGIPLIIVLVFSGVSITLAILHYLRKRQKRLHQALEQYRRRPLPKKGINM